METKKDGFTKKYGQAIKVLGAIILIILLLFVINVGRKWFILEGLVKKFDQHSNLSNYFIEYEGLVSKQSNAPEEAASISVRQTYFKDGNFLTKSIVHNTKEKEITVTVYKNGEEKVAFMEIEGRRQSLDFGEFESLIFKPTSYVKESKVNLFYMAMFYKINQTSINGKDYYCISNQLGEDCYIDAETGITSKIVNVNQSLFTNIEYKPQTVQNIVRPDYIEE